MLKDQLIISNRLLSKIASTFEETILKSALNYRVKLENMQNSKWVRKKHIITFSKNLYVKKCISFISRCGLGRVNIMIDEGRRVEWKTITENRESMNWRTKRWKK